jgi:hypothetical protein
MELDTAAKRPEQASSQGASASQDTGGIERIRFRSRHRRVVAAVVNLN